MHSHMVNSDVEDGGPGEHVGSVAGVQFSSMHDNLDLDPEFAIYSDSTVVHVDKTVDEGAMIGADLRTGAGVPVDYETGGMPGLVNRLPYGIGPVTSGEDFDLRGKIVRFRRRPQTGGGPVTESGTDFATAMMQDNIGEADAASFQSALALGE